MALVGLYCLLHGHILCPSHDTEDLPGTCMACSRVSSFFPTHFLRDTLILAIECLRMPSFLACHPSSKPLSVLLLLLRARICTYARSCLPLRVAPAAVMIKKESPHVVIRDIIVSLCFHSLDSAPVFPMAPPPGKHCTWPVGPAN
jgi:hypothetical protein